MITNYRTLRAVSATDDTGLAADGAKYSDVSSLLVPTLNVQAGEVSIIFKGTDATDETMNWCLYAVRDINSPAEFIAHGTATIGATETGADDEYYADTITVTKEAWLRPLNKIDGYQYNLGTGAITSGGIAKLSFDTMEYKYLICLMSKGTCATCGADYTLTY
jgi:hypothetical protein